MAGEALAEQQAGKTAPMAFNRKGGIVLDEISYDFTVLRDRSINYIGG